MPKELVLAGATTMTEANAQLRDTYIPAHNARFAIKAEQEGSAFVAVPELDLAELLCIQEECVVGNDNCVSFLNRRLQIPESSDRRRAAGRALEAGGVCGDAHAIVGSV